MFDFPPTEIHESFIFYSLVPEEANQGWKMELFDLNRPTSTHYHKVQRQYILLLDGEVTARRGQEKINMESGEMVRIEPGIVHSLTPKEKCRFLAIDMPAAGDDVFSGEPNGIKPWISSAPKDSIEKKYYSKKYVSETHTVYELIEGSATGGKWSAALIEIQDVPRHFHRIEKEHFIVVHGALQVEAKGKTQILKAGDSITFLPNQAHRLKSASADPAQVLCFNFPAFDPADMHFTQSENKSEK